MPGILESMAGTNGFAGVLSESVATISGNQTITFRRYVRLILPVDGSAFWVRSDLLTPSALLNAFGFNTVDFNQGATVAAIAQSISIKGSLHYTVDNSQNETEGFAVNNMIFTSKVEIELLDSIDPQSLWIGEYNGLRFAFSHLTMRYKQSEIFHYTGFAVYPSMATQVVDDPLALDVDNVIVSNSLPVWLSLSKFCPMYPSYLVDQNIMPPYCAVHIDPENTSALQSAPYSDRSGSSWQLTQDKVRLTFYGLRNFSAQDFMAYVSDYTLSHGDMGVMNIPIVKDAKRTQAELNTLAQKKYIDYEVSYHQTRMRELSRQLILSAFITIYPE